ncbi:hypothetical protein AMECASPLE_007262 [Ameca splendens]|uniref:Alpha-2-macroglobulin RAP C-terminal domain-containing protein n=1 Tax=Ameca splendens TaxID=208324 RepID=A0ABV0YLQ9_9TELE
MSYCQGVKSWISSSDSLYVLLLVLPLQQTLLPLSLKSLRQDCVPQKVNIPLWLCYAVILAKYGMDGKRDMRPMESNSLKDHEVKDGEMFDDPKLDKLWNKAKSSGKFSNEELASLKREFQHHKDKIHEYNILMDTVSRTEEIHKNVISPMEGDTKEHVLQQKHTELKEKMRDLNHGFERLRKISHEGFSQDSEFREPRVIELWEAAKRANLSKDELESLKEELRHFETKVEKHSHYQEQLELSHQKLRHVESLGDKEHIKRNQEKYNTLAEKTREMGYKVKRKKDLLKIQMLYLMHSSPHMNSLNLADYWLCFTCDELFTRASCSLQKSNKFRNLFLLFTRFYEGKKGIGLENFKFRLKWMSGSKMVNKALKLHQSSQSKL